MLLSRHEIHDDEKTLSMFLFQASTKSLISQKLSLYTGGSLSIYDMCSKIDSKRCLDIVPLSLKGAPVSQLTEIVLQTFFLSLLTFVDRSNYIPIHRKNYPRLRSDRSSFISGNMFPSIKSQGIIVRNILTMPIPVKPPDKTTFNFTFSRMPPSFF